MVIWFASRNTEGDLEITSNQQVKRPKWSPKVGDVVRPKDSTDGHRVILVYTRTRIPLNRFIEGAKMMGVLDSLELLVAWTAEAYAKPLKKTQVKP